MGVISGGWFWYNNGVKTEQGQPIQATWPARASNVAGLAELVTRVTKCPGGACDQQDPTQSAQRDVKENATSDDAISDLARRR